MRYQPVSKLELQDKLASNQNIRLVCYGCGGSLQSAVRSVDLYSYLDYFVDQNKKTVKIEQKDQTEKVYSCISFPELLDVIEKNPNEEWVFLITSVYWKQIIKKLDQIEMLQEKEIYIWPLMQIRDEMQGGEETLYQKRLITPSLTFYRKLLKYQGYDRNVLEEQIVEKERFLKEKENGRYKNLVLPKLVFFLTTKCTLQCRECTALIPKFEKTVELVLNSVLDDMNRVLDAVDEVIFVQLAGGESLLYPQLDKVLAFLIEHEKVLGITFVTNATIIPDEKILKLLEHEKVYISISDYGMLDKLCKIVTLFEKRGIAFEVLTSQHWMKVGGTEYRGKTMEDLQFEYLRCPNGEGCKMVEKGKLHICDRSARMYLLGQFKSSHDYCDIDCSVQERRERIRTMYLAEYADACNYCDYANVDAKIIEPAEQLGKQIERSAYTIVKRG